MMRSVSASRSLSPTVGPNICAYAARFIRWGILDVLGNRNSTSRLDFWQLAHHRLVEAVGHARTAIWNQPDFTRLPRLEPHGCPRRNIQAIAKSSLSVESESCVRLGKMIVTTDLDWPIACVRDFQRNCGPIPI